MSRNKWNPRRYRGLSTMGLLFMPSIRTYEERMWQRAHDAAIADGASEDDARRIADDAAIAAKGEKTE